MSETATCSRYCGGNVAPSRFVKSDTVAGKVIQATDGSASHGSIIFGVSQEGTWQVPLGVPGGSALDDGYAGTTSSPPIKVYLVGAECFIEAGAAFALDDRLKADANGKAITASSGDNIGAVALQAATAAGQLVRCRVMPSITMI